MAISKISTLLPLDEYSRIMQIPDWHFNQVLHPTYQYHDSCDRLFLQSSAMGSPPRGLGRDNIAGAIRTAEQVIRRRWGFSIGPHWEYAHLEWPVVGRGLQADYPLFRAPEGYLIEGGVEAWEQINVYPITISYSNEDNDGVLDTATISFSTTVTDPCEIVIVPVNKDPADREWRIRPLDIEISGGTCTAIGPRWLFVDPDRWLTDDELHLEDDSDFLSEVDVWRHYNDDSTQAKIYWEQSLNCADTCQTACITVRSPRIGSFILTPAMYSAGSWTATTPTYCLVPKYIEVWYRAGYREFENGCEGMSEAMKEALVSLTNCFLPEPPCGCMNALRRWERDNEEMEITSAAAAKAEAIFGRLTRGMFMAYQILSSIPPIGEGGGFRK